MRFDDIFRRCFVVVVCFLLGAAAYFQAAGVAQLAGVALDLDPAAARSSLDSLARAPSSAGASPNLLAYGHATSADAILDRNPFDSITGPLTPLDPVPSGERKGASLIGADPFADPLCEGARVFLITESDDPAWSFAAVAVGPGGAVLRRLGDDVNGLVLGAVGRDRIWLSSDHSRCQVVLGAQPPAATPAGPRPPSRGAASAAPPAPPSSALPPEIASKIRQIGERNIEIERSAIDAVLERQGDLLGRVRVRPEKDGDRVVGLRLSGVAPGSLLSVLGLQSGDRLSTINGFSISDPTSALELYARLRYAGHLVVSIDRRGTPMNFDISIK